MIIIKSTPQDRHNLYNYLQEKWAKIRAAQAKAFPIPEEEETPFLKAYYASVSGNKVSVESSKFEDYDYMTWEKGEQDHTDYVNK